MTTQSVFLPGKLADVATYRAWGLGISTALDALGIIKTADPQANWSTAPLPAAFATPSKEFRRFNDALNPKLYMMIDYGLGNNGNPRPFFYLGTGTDGAGNITGQVAGYVGVEPGNTAYTVGQTFRYLFSGDASRLTIAYMLDTSDFLGGQIISLERLKNGDGTDSVEGFSIYVYSRTTGMRHIVIPANGIVTPINTNQVCVAAAAETGLDGTDVGLFPIFPVRRSKVYNPSLGVMSYFLADIPYDSNIVASAYGANHTFKTLGSNFIGQMPGVTAANCGLLMRYE